MATHSSATVREQEPHVNQATVTSKSALKRRARTPDKNEDVYCEPETDQDEPIQEALDVLRQDKIIELAELICGAGDESAGALLLLMGLLQNSEDPEVVVNTVKHLAFTRCGEMNLNGMVDAQIVVLESELLAGKPVAAA